MSDTVTAQDLSAVAEQLVGIVNELTTTLAQEVSSVRNSIPVPAVVLAVAEKGSEEEELFGYGAAHIS